MCIGDSSTPEAEAVKYLRVNNLALEGRPADMAVTTHFSAVLFS